MPRRLLVLVVLLCAPTLALSACDEEPTTAPPPAQPSEVGTDPPAPQPSEAQTEAPEPEPEPKPEPPPGPSCDRRGSNAEGPANFTCIDYGEHRGALEPRCAEGLSLAEAGCPREAIVSRCRLPATGVRLFYYEGVEADAASRECELLDGDYLAGPPA